MAKLKIEIPAPCNYEAQLANEKDKDCVVINAYNNKEKEQGEPGEK